MKFNELNIDENILRALREIGYREPTPIQEKAIPPVLAGRDLLGCAQTGTGKTCAFAVPIIQRLKREGQRDAIRALVLTPTRELALQIYENVCQYARYTRCQSAVIYGGVPQSPQVEAIQRGADILIATPGRLWDLMNQGVVHLDNVQVFVLDEADRMLDMGFFPDVQRIIGCLPEKRQTLLFSATMPREISVLAGELLQNPVRIAITPPSTPVDTIEQSVYFVERTEKRELLAQIIRQKNVKQALVFTRTKHGADRVARDLLKAGIPARALHSDKSQNQRQTALADFKAGRITALVATDIAARGLDICDLPLVVNFDLPNTPDIYVHRIGRTGRAGQAGTAVSFCEHLERPYLSDIERTIGTTVSVAGRIPHVAKERTPRQGDTSETAAVSPVMKSVAAQLPCEETTSRRVRPTALRSSMNRTVSSGNEMLKSAPRSSMKRTASSGNETLKSAPRSSMNHIVSTGNETWQAAPRPHFHDGRGKQNNRSRRRDSEAYEPRFDAHTPSHAEALSAEAAARIRKKVEAGLAARAVRQQNVVLPAPRKNVHTYRSRQRVK